ASAHGVSSSSRSLTRWASRPSRKSMWASTWWMSTRCCACTRPSSGWRSSASLARSRPRANSAKVWGALLTGQDGVKQVAPALAQDVGGDGTELEVGALQELVEAVDLLGALVRQRLTLPRPLTQRADRRRGNETGVQQAVPQQVRQPFGVLDVGLV